MYDENNLLIGFTYTNGSNVNNYYYLRDSLMNILGIINSNSVLVVTYSYDAFGNYLSMTDNSTVNIGTINPIRYKGYYYDTETGLFYCKSRYYNPEWGRWLSADSIDYLDPESINGLNLFAYCGNNPVMNADPSGHIFFSALFVGAIVGAVFGFSSTVLKDYLDDGEVFNESISFGDYALSTIIGGVTGAIGGVTSNILIQMGVSGALDVTKGVLLKDIDSFGEGVKTFLTSAFVAGISYGISSSISKVIGKIQYKSLRGLSTSNGKVNTIIKQLGKKYNFFSNMRIGKNNINEFINAYSKTMINSIFSSISSGVVDMLMVPLDFY